MTLAPGARLGAYEIVALAGAGGMGKVYRGRDTRLNRDVALKVLPSAVALDPDRLARFEREAQILASIGHPNIAGIFGIEQSCGVGPRAEGGRGRRTAPSCSRPTIRQPDCGACRSAAALRSS